MSTVSMKTVKPTIPGLVTLVKKDGKARSLAARLTADGANGLRLWEVEGFVFEGNATCDFELTHLFIATRDRGIVRAFIGTCSVYQSKGDSVVVGVE